MKRGEVWLADLEPVLGAESDKARPVVLVSNDGANERAAALGRGVVTVVPVTSNVARVFNFHVLLEPQDSGLRRRSKAQVEQVRSIDVRRLSRRLGRVDPQRAWEIDEALRVHLAL